MTNGIAILLKTTSLGILLLTSWKQNALQTKQKNNDKEKTKEVEPFW